MHPFATAVFIGLVMLGVTQWGDYDRRQTRAACAARGGIAISTVDGVQCARGVELVGRP